MAAKTVLLCVPLRMGSTRLKQKVLSKIDGKELAVWTVERVLQTNGHKNKKVHVVAGVDDPAVASLLQVRFGNEVSVQMTPSSCPSGTDRVAAAANQYLRSQRMPWSEVSGVVNVQGDTPFVSPEAIDRVCSYYIESSAETLCQFPMATLAEAWPERTPLSDKSKVKVLLSKSHRALYFSRHAIPYGRLPAPKSSQDAVCQMHIGVYGYTPDALSKLVSSPPHPMELCEGLEQLRALYLDIPILVLQAEARAGESFRGVDTVQDLSWANRFAKALHKVAVQAGHAKNAKNKKYSAQKSSKKR